MRKIVHAVGLASGVLVTAVSASAIADGTPAGLKRAAECMLGILQTTQGVTDAKIYSDQSRLCLQYRADEKSRWIGPAEFCLQSARSATQGPYDFWAVFPGVTPPGEEPDIHVSEAIMQKWNAQCGVRAIGVFE